MSSFPSPAFPFSLSTGLMTFLGRHSSRPEELLTHGLLYLLQSDAGLRRQMADIGIGDPVSLAVFEGFSRFSARMARTCSDPASPVEDSEESNAFHQSVAIPDLAGVDPAGQVRLIVELKVDATFTPAQLPSATGRNSYHSHLASGSGSCGLLYVVPRYRLQEVKEALSKALQVHFKLSPQQAAVTPVNPHQKELLRTILPGENVSGETRLTVVSWQCLLHMLAGTLPPPPAVLSAAVVGVRPGNTTAASRVVTPQAINPPGNGVTSPPPQSPVPGQPAVSGISTDLALFRALAQAILAEDEGDDPERWGPFSAPDLSPHQGAVLLQINNLIELSLREAERQGIGTMGAYASGPPMWMGRYFKFPTYPLLERLPHDPVPHDPGGAEAGLEEASGEIPGAMPASISTRTPTESEQRIREGLPDLSDSGEPVAGVELAAGGAGGSAGASSGHISSPGGTANGSAEPTHWRKLLLFFSAKLWSREVGPWQSPLWVEILCAPQEKRLLGALLRFGFGGPDRLLLETKEGFVMNIHVPADTTRQATVDAVVSQIEAICKTA